MNVKYEPCTNRKGSTTEREIILHVTDVWQNSKEIFAYDRFVHSLLPLLEGKRETD